MPIYEMFQKSRAIEKCDDGDFNENYFRRENEKKTWASKEAETKELAFLIFNKKILKLDSSNTDFMILLENHSNNGLKWLSLKF